MSIELRVWDKIPRNALACLVVAAIGCPLALGQAASETLGSKDVPVLALLKRIEELEASQKLMQQKIDQLTGGTARQPLQAEPVVSHFATAEPPAEAIADDDHDYARTVETASFQQLRFWTPLVSATAS
jgi:hypothetical protein